jgi:hypothetical protein
MRLHNRTTPVQLSQYPGQELHSKFFQFIIVIVLLITTLVIASLLLPRISTLLLTTLLRPLIESTLLTSLVVTILRRHCRRPALEIDIHPPSVCFC